MGTPEFAEPSLRLLKESGYQIEGVFTQPDRPAGRGKIFKASPIKVLAESLGLPVFQPLKIKTPEVLAILRELNPECIIVVAYGQILSKEILSLPRYGCVNVHASLLPAYRGAAPVHWAVINGEKRTGVTTMLMNEGLDTGDILLKSEYEISGDVNTGEVYDVLAELGAKLLVSTLQGLKKQSLKPVAQTQDGSYAPLLTREDERLDWSWNTSEIHNRIRGLNPWPGSFTYYRSEQVKIWQSRILGADKARNYLDQGCRPGQIVSFSEGGLLLATGDGILEIIWLQPAGKKKMNARDFFYGRRGRIGEFFTLNPDHYQ